MFVLPPVMEALMALAKSAESPGLPKATVHLVHLRASQINGCSVCVELHSRWAKQAGETDQRLFSVAAWRDAPWFSEPERAALALTECLTRIADQPDPIPDAIWSAATEHYDDKAISALLVAISAINVWNRLNVATRQLAGVRMG